MQEEIIINVGGNNIKLENINKSNISSILEINFPIITDWLYSIISSHLKSNSIEKIIGFIKEGKEYKYYFRLGDSFSKIPMFIIKESGTEPNIRMIIEDVFHKGLLSDIQEVMNLSLQIFTNIEYLDNLNNFPKEKMINLIIQTINKIKK